MYFFRVREPLASARNLKRIKNTALSYDRAVVFYGEIRGPGKSGFSVLATGHNLDDETATLPGNILNWEVDNLGRKGEVEG